MASACLPSGCSLSSVCSASSILSSSGSVQVFVLLSSDFLCCCVLTSCPPSCLFCASGVSVRPPLPSTCSARRDISASGMGGDWSGSRNCCTRSLLSLLGYRRNRKNTIVFESRVFGRTDESVPTGLSSLTSGSFCLVSFSDSLTSCFRNPPGTTDRGGGGVGVTSGAFSSFICGHQGEHKGENLHPSGGKRTISSSFIHSNHSCYCCCPSGWMRALIGVWKFGCLQVPH